MFVVEFVFILENENIWVLLVFILILKFERKKYVDINFLNIV